jgi:translation initiation factor IF-3
LSRPFPSRSTFPLGSMVRVNGKIRAREVRVIGPEGQQLGIFGLADAINMARARGVDLVEIAATATPPVCRLVDFGKYRYEQAKKDKEARKHQHANKVKEVQLSPQIDPHDFVVKLNHAIDFLCEEMKVKVTLRFRGREMAHKEFGFNQIEKFTKEVAPYGHPDAPAKLVGKGITVMFSPLPRNKRAKNPRQPEGHEAPEGHDPAHGHVPRHGNAQPAANSAAANSADAKPVGDPKTSSDFSNNPFNKLDLPASPEPDLSSPVAPGE